MHRICRSQYSLYVPRIIQYPANIIHASDIQNLALLQGKTRLSSRLVAKFFRRPRRLSSRTPIGPSKRNKIRKHACRRFFDACSWPRCAIQRLLIHFRSTPVDVTSREVRSFSQARLSIRRSSAQRGRCFRSAPLRARRVHSIGLRRVSARNVIAT